MVDTSLNAKKTALTICFAALYAVFGFIPISPIIGLPGKAITAAAIMAPVIGIIVGPYLGVLSTVLGGAIGFFSGVFSPPSFVSGAVAALCAGTLRKGQRSTCAFIYFSFLFFFCFYPFVGPVWLYPPLMWFQIAGFLMVVSPLQTSAIKNFNSSSDKKTLQAFFITCLTSTLAGQIAGSLTFEIISWPIFVADVMAWRAYWQGLTFLYPLERIIIALGASLVGTSLNKALRTVNIKALQN